MTAVQLEKMNLALVAFELLSLTGARWAQWGLTGEVSLTWSGKWHWNQECGPLGVKGQGEESSGPSKPGGESEIGRSRSLV